MLIHAVMITHVIGAVGLRSGENVLSLSNTSCNHRNITAVLELQRVIIAQLNDERSAGDQLARHTGAVILRT